MSNYKTKHGFSVYARMLDYLKTPRTSREVAEKIGVGACNGRVILRGLYSLGLLHVHGWKRVSPVGIWDRVYAAGEGVDAPAPMKTTGQVSTIRATKTRPKPALIAFAALWRALDEPVTVVDIVEETGIGEQAIYRFLRNAHAERITQIVGWTRVYRGPAALYGKGSGENKRRPPRETRAVVSKRKREKAKRTQTFDALTWRHAA